MAYRDDEEALHHRVDSLETDLAEARQKLSSTQSELDHHRSKDTRDEAQIEGLQQEVSRLRAKLGMAPPSPPTAGRRLLVVALGVMVAIVGAGAAGWLLLTPGAPERVEVPEVRAPSAAPDLAAPAPAEPVPPAPPPTAGPADVALFGAEVLAAEGRDVEPGDGCVLAVALTYGPGIGRVTVRCGAEMLYDSLQPVGTSMQRLRRGIGEMAGSTSGTFVYAVEYTDFGARQGPRSQIVATSELHSMRVYDEGARPFSVTFHLQDRSAERVGVSLSADAAPPTTGLGSVLHVRARPRTATGPAPRGLAPGAPACELRVRPHAVATSPFDCRITLRCGSEIIYGAGSAGYSRCIRDRGVPVAADDEGTTSDNGDPIMHFDWREHRIAVADDRGAERWTAELTLDEHPAVSRFQGTWEGSAIGASGGDGAFLVQAAGDRARLAWRGPGGEGTADGRWSVDSLHRTLRIDAPTGDGDGAESDGGSFARYRMSYGPGFSTLLGTAEGGEFPVLALSRRRAR